MRSHACLNVAEGESSRLDERTARELAQFVTVSLKGKRNSTPTIEVNDKGIGIHPSEFADSILDLNESDKGQKTYLVGMYGQGGSSTFDKCEYTVIVSRRHPAHLSDGQSDEVGWTVVRKSLHVRATVYTYFVDHDTGSVPVFCGSISDQIGVDYGTTITHLEYRDTGGFAHTSNHKQCLLHTELPPLQPTSAIGHCRTVVKPQMNPERCGEYHIESINFPLYPAWAPRNSKRKTKQL